MMYAVTQIYVMLHGGKGLAYHDTESHSPLCVVIETGKAVVVVFLIQRPKQFSRSGVAQTTFSVHLYLTRLAPCLGKHT